MAIRYVKRKDIDVGRWDAAIASAPNGLIYATSVYLDHQAAGQWDALIEGDYSRVMPLPWRKKWTIFYLYQPFAVASLGIFGAELNEQVVAAFLHTIPRKFQYWDIYFNHAHPLQVDGFKQYTRQNFILPLAGRKAQDESGYRENLRRNIRKSREAGCVMTAQVDWDELFQLARQSAARFGTVSEADYTAFRHLAVQLQQEERAFAFGIQSARNELLASALFLRYRDRLTYILVGNHPNGKTIGASHLLIHEVISSFAGKDLVLDFEGSDVQNVAFFYTGYGAEAEQYPAIKWNRLPKALAWLKD